MRNFPDTRGRLADGLEEFWDLGFSDLGFGDLGFRVCGGVQHIGCRGCALA